MKIFLPLILFNFLLLNNCFAQKPLFGRFQYNGITGDEQTNGIVSDEKNNAYIIGQINDTIIFNGKKYGSNVYYKDRGYLLKFNSLGNPQWINLIGSDSGYADAETLCYDGNGHIYVIGECLGTVNIGTDIYVTSQNIFSLFIAKYDTAGNYIWSRILDSLSFDITSDNLGNIYLLGGNFVIKYNPDGRIIWAQTYSVNQGTFLEYGNIRVDNSGNIFCTGELYCSYSNHPELYFNGDTLKGTFQANAFLLKYDSLGNPDWAKLIIGNFVTPTSLGIANTGIVYLTGNLDNNTGGSSGSSFIKKFDTNGNLIQTDSIPTPALFSYTLKSGSTHLLTYNYNFNKYDTSGILVHSDSINYYYPSNSPYFISPSSMNATEQGTVFICGDMLGSLDAGRDVLVSLRPRTYYEVLGDPTYSPPGTQNSIKGIVYNDINSNCVQDHGENGISGVTIYCPEMSEYTLTDSIGAYKLYVDTGSNSVVEILPNQHSTNLHVICPADTVYHIIIKHEGIDTTGFNFSNSEQECSLLCVKFNGPSAIQCGYYHNFIISTSNFGIMNVYNALLTLHFPGNMKSINSTPSSDSLSYVDSTMFFRIDSILPNQTIEIQITDSLICNNNSGYDYFNYPFLYVAIIKPYNNCYPPDTVFNLDGIFDQYFASTLNINSINKDIIIYPNPSQNEFTIEIPDKAGAYIECTTLLGQQVLKSGINKASSKMEVNTSSLSNGLYFVKVFDENNNLIGVGKFVKN